MRNLNNFRQAVESPKFKIQSATFVGKNTFLQLKHYIHRIYLTLLSTTYVKLHQVPLVIFKTISHFSQHNSFALFQLTHEILLTKISHQSANFPYICYGQKQHIKVPIFRFSTAHIKIYQICHVIFETKSQFFFKLYITLEI